MFDLLDLLNLPGRVALSGSSAGGACEEVGPPETESLRSKFGER